MKTYTDFEGRVYKTVYPDGFCQETEFDGFGRTIKQTDSEYNETVYEYDASGKMVLQSVNEFETRFASGWRERDSKVVQYHETWTPYETLWQLESMSETSRDGLFTWSEKNELPSSVERHYLGNGLVKEIITNPDNSSLINNYTCGMLVSTGHSELGVTAYFYDEFNRAVGSDHEEDGVMVSIRHTLDQAGRVLAYTCSTGIPVLGGSSSAACSNIANLTSILSTGSLLRMFTYAYDTVGRKTSETTPEGLATNYVYNTMGQLSEISGAAYKQKHTYNQSRIAL